MLLYIKKMGGFVNEQNEKMVWLGVTLLSASILVACGNSSSKSDDTSKEAKTEKKASTEKSSERNQPMQLVIRLFLINKLSTLLQMLNGLMNGMILIKQIPIKY